MKINVLFGTLAGAHVFFSGSVILSLTSVSLVKCDIWKESSNLTDVNHGTKFQLYGTKNETKDDKNNNTEKDLLDRYKRDFDGLDEASEFGLRAMYEFFEVQEKKLFELGIFLETNHPARYIATFNQQSDEAKNLSKIAFAALKGSNKLSDKYGNFSKDIFVNISNGMPDKFWKNHRKNFQERCPRNDDPHCSPASLKYRTADGSCNNFKHPWLGSAMSTMQRFLNPIYDDGIETIRKSKSGKPLPSPRDISLSIHQDKNVSLASLTHMLMQWGQFIDHDLTATAQSRGFNGSFPQCCQKFGTMFQPPELMHPDCLPITVSSQDEFYGKFGVRCLEFVRSGPAPRKDCGFGPREQLSQATSFLDGSMIYSSNIHQSDGLRLFHNGLLQYGSVASKKSIFQRKDDICQRGSLSTNCFKAGDARLSEQPALTALHIIFLRLHNKIALELGDLNPHWDDERLFQESRKIVGAIIQHITYHEFLPVVLGSTVMHIFGLELKRSGYYEGYDSSINPTIANSFSTAAYRFGHSLVQHGFSRHNNHHNIIFDNITIHEEFNNKLELHSVGSVDRLLLGLINQPSQRRDEFITRELTNHLFQLPSFSFGMDLASINIQRGRDHGLRPYTDWREPCGLATIRSWQDLEQSLSLEVSQKFKNIYEFVEDIDLFSAGISEKSVPGGLVGPTFACIIAQQFINLRKGDRFWYENSGFESSFSLLQLKQIRQITLSRIMCQTMDDIDTIQPFVFLTPDVSKNKRISCTDKKLSKLRFDPWMEKKVEDTKSTLIDLVERKMNTTSLNNREKKFPLLDRTSIKTDVNQKNRIVIKQPLGTNYDNLTLNVQNHAVNSPFFIKDFAFNPNFFSSSRSREYKSNENEGHSLKAHKFVRSTESLIHRAFDYSKLYINEDSKNILHSAKLSQIINHVITNNNELPKPIKLDSLTEKE